MGTVPTGKLERELRKLYLNWVMGLPRHDGDILEYIDKFRRDSETLIARMGGQVARLGVYLADFPAPRELTLSPVAGVIYDQMKQAAISAGIMSGLNATDMARIMLRAGLDSNFKRLNRLARTETVSAYWKNQWDSTRGLDLVMVWSSETSARTCDYCKERDGLVVEDPNIRDHPNGRCTLVPMSPHRVEYKGTLRPDGTVYMDPAWKASSDTPTVGYGTAETVPTSDLLDRGRQYKLNLPREERLTYSRAQNAADYYGSAAGYKDINTALRAKPGTKGAQRLAEIKHGYIDPLRQALYGQQTTQPMLVNRGLKDLAGLRSLIPRGGTPMDLVGKVFEEKGFMSTSYRPAPNNFGLRPNQMVIEVPAGTYGARMDDFYRASGMGDQYEFLMPPGGRIEITSVEQVGLDPKGNPAWKIRAKLISQAMP